MKLAQSVRYTIFDKVFLLDVNYKRAFISESGANRNNVRLPPARSIAAASGRGGRERGGEEDRYSYAL